MTDTFIFRFCDKKFKDYSGRSQHEKRVHNRGPLARGRRKGYKMDRDQLYSPPQQTHHFVGELGDVVLALTSFHFCLSFFFAFIFSSGWQPTGW